MKRKAKYRGIPCWLDTVTDELTGRNRFYDILVDIVLWFDINVLALKELRIWVEVDDLEKNN